MGAGQRAVAPADSASLGPGPRRSRLRGGSCRRCSRTKLRRDRTGTPRLRQRDDSGGRRRRLRPGVRDDGSESHRAGAVRVVRASKRPRNPKASCPSRARGVSKMRGRPLRETAPNRCNESSDVLQLACPTVGQGSAAPGEAGVRRGSGGHLRGAPRRRDARSTPVEPRPRRSRSRVIPAGTSRFSPDQQRCVQRIAAAARPWPAPGTMLRDMARKEEWEARRAKV